MKLNVGDKVRLLNEPGEGVVKKVVSNEEIWVEIDAFEYPYPIFDLIKIEDDNSVQFVKKADAIAENEKSKTKILHSKKFDFARTFGAMSNIFKKVNPRGIPEVDLHIENLSGNYKLKLDKREALQFQMEYLKYIIEEAEKNSVREIMVIHGKGEGVLKTEVRKLLGSMANVEYWDGTFQFYGTGATHVKIYY